MATYRRTKHFIDSNVQGALARRIILHWLVFAIVTSLVLFILQVLSNPFRPLADAMQDLWSVQGPFMLVMVFILPVFVVDTIKLSHRFAGPIFSLRREIREVAQGKAPRKMKFRQNDFWQDLAEDYNTMLSRFGAFNSDADEVTEDAEVIALK